MARVHRRVWGGYRVHKSCVRASGAGEDSDQESLASSVVLLKRCVM